ncbi:hypothetical protein J3E69DRAFT_336553 [Trichoderma sp. SZMC 28015]
MPVLLIHLMLTYLVLVLISLASANRREYHQSAKVEATSLQGLIALQATRQCTNTQVNRCQILVVRHHDKRFR